MHINHITLSTNHPSRIERGDVQGETLARVAPWIEAALAASGPMALPVSALAHYSARVLTDRGALVCTVYGPTGSPMVTMAVAKRSRHGAALWPQMSALPGVRKGLKRPAEPWCAAHLLPSPGLLEASHWLGDFERCVAWAWCTRAIDTAADE